MNCLEYMNMYNVQDEYNEGVGSGRFVCCRSSSPCAVLSGRAGQQSATGLIDSSIDCDWGRVSYRGGSGM